MPYTMEYLERRRRDQFYRSERRAAAVIIAMCAMFAWFLVTAI
jgi:hypothetical protein